LKETELYVDGYSFTEKVSDPEPLYEWFIFIFVAK
jgi:hypothetical protein